MMMMMMMMVMVMMWKGKRQGDGWLDGEKGRWLEKDG